MECSAHDLLKLVKAEREPVGLKDGGAARWIMVQDDNGQAKLLRNLISTTLFRGQNTHVTPCWPSLCRGFYRNTSRVAALTSIDQAHLLKRLALNRWFADELSNHPMMKWAKSENLYVDKIAIAQHYGIPTSHIDLSESLAVAVFFATCRYSKETNSWTPMDTGRGVIYKLQFIATHDRLAPICYQPLPRPAEQWAWTAELRLGENLLNIPNVQAYYFEHNASVGEEVLRLFNGGDQLFPLDPTARLALEIMSSKTVPIQYIEEVEAWFIRDPLGLDIQETKQLRKILKNELKIDLTNAPVAGYTEDELKFAKSELLKLKSNFYDDVSTRLTKKL